MMGPGGPPPDLGALLGGAGGPQAPDRGGGSPEELLGQILDLCDQYRGVEKDHEDLLAIEKVSTLVQQLLAAQQKNTDQLLGNPALAKALR